MKHKSFGTAMALCLLLTFALAGCSFDGIDTEQTIGDPSLNEDGEDWQSTGLYNNMFSLSDSTYVYLLDLEDGYSVYISAKDSDDEPNHLCDIYLDEQQTNYSYDELTNEIVVEDLDGDGTGEIGLAVSDGNILWYQLDLENYSCQFLKAAPKNTN